ncbi:Bet1-like SNARE 1-1 [Capsicum annuum]|nr:Bet1-like SNARE 1-1 [Capsicum annuum]KAF3648885.1 Bet1-like SNARE 1-1 [Capsicum annuum]
MAHASVRDRYCRNSGRERSNRVALFDGIEEGGIRASSSYGSHEIDEQENEKAMDGLQDRVNLLKRRYLVPIARGTWQLSGDIHEEVETHNRMLDRMGNDMDSSRGVLSGTMDKFKMVFETKSSRRMFTLVASFVVLFLVVYYLTSPNIVISGTYFDRATKVLTVSAANIILKIVLSAKFAATPFTYLVPVGHYDRG